MKLNWGHYIVIGFSAFVLFILFMVYKSYQHKNELVAEDYYQQEIEFQDVIDKKTNAARLEQDIEWKMTDNGLLITYPNFEDNEVIGEIYLFRPSDKSKDRRYPIELDQNRQQLLSDLELIKGKYLVKIDWKVGEIEFFTEGALYVVQ